MKRYIYYFVIIVFFLTAGVCYLLFIQKEKPEEVYLSSLTETTSSIESAEVVQAGGDEETKEEKKLLVHICGAVRKPGVYEFLEGARIMEAIAAAGGFTEDAAEGYLNLALKLSDEQKVYIPTASELLEQPAGLPPFDEAAVPKNDGKVNINTASAADLMKLSGIGEKKADNIIAYREANGYFKDTKDLLKVDGISTSTYEKLKDLITVKSN